MSGKREKFNILNKFYFLHTFIIFSLVLLSSSSYSQFITPVFENISIEDGLPENSVTCIVQDYLGYLWLGTQNGLVRYDGYTMKVFQPEDINQDNLRVKGIVSLYEDKEKTLWICTLNGLFKYNRSDESFKCYKNNVNDNQSISSDLVHSIYEDNKGRLWIGTQEGLSLFDREKQKFTNYYFYLKESEVITTSIQNPFNLSVNAINENPITGELLIGTCLEGMWKFNLTKRTFTKYNFKDIRVDKKIGYIQSFNISKDKKIWMASYHTLCSLNPGTGEFISYIEFPVKEEERYWKPDFVNASILEDYNGLIWCAFNAGGKGIFCLDEGSKYFQNYKPVSEGRNNGYTNKIYMIYKDRSGILWIGTWGTGLWKWDNRKKKFLMPYNGLNNLKTLNNLSASSFAYDSNGFIWFSTPKGLEKYEIKKGRFYHYLQNESCLTQYDVYSTFLDKLGNIWLGTSRCGLIKFNPKNGSYHFFFDKPEELGNKIIITMYQDHLGFIWIGTDGFGLYKYDILKNKLTHYSHNPNDPSSLPGNRARVIFEDNSKTLWIGTDIGGLGKFDRRTEKFLYCGFSSVLSIHEDRKGNFWVGDYFTGLNLFDRNNNKVIKCYKQSDGLASYSIWGILEDKHNNLWIKTDNGLLKFNTDTKRFKRFTKLDGLTNNFFSPFGSYIGPDSILFFNTGKGLVIFNPDNIKNDPTPPQVIISNVSLFNRSGKKLRIKGFIPELNVIKIPYYDNDLRFDYVGLQYSEPEKNSYKYILENFDNDWVDAGNQRNATYTNLEPGEYVFRVNSANRDGIWNIKGASLKIIITPPWWKTNLAYIFFALIFFSMIYFIWKMQLKRIRIKHEYEMSRFEAEKLHEIDEIKTNFFTNISHEFRTPLTLILGPVKQMIDETKEQKSKEKLNVVHRNAKRLLNLVNQLLEITKLESGNMKLKAYPQDIIPFLKAIILSFTSYAERKNITLKFGNNDEEIIVYFDKEKIEKIITNVLSNAFKFTPEGGCIEVCIKSNLPADATDQKVISSLRAERSNPIFGTKTKDCFTLPQGGIVRNDFSPLRGQPQFKKGYVQISIRDTGVGIPKEKIPKIFDRFYQADQAHTREYEGTGIGLAFTKELIELHKGTIEVESTEGKGTTFKINIPLGKDHLKPEEIFTNDVDKPLTIHSESLVEEPIVNNNYKFIIQKGKAVLLIVEDNNDVRNYIKQNLENNFNIIEACDGEEGWEKSINQIPDLIISDVMMPKLDGFKLCDKLKSDERTSHIPIILLTAKASSKDKINGFKLGADDYIMKPFEPDELSERIKNLIEQRRRIHEHFRNHGLLELNDSKVNNIDKEFLTKVINTISDNMNSEFFSVEVLAEKLFISRSLLHKKLVSLTGESPVELIRRTRLLKASELMEKKFGNLSQIAMEVGFNNSAYFTECFKKQFGLSPSQYQHKIKNN